MDARRKRLLYRSQHRGTREADILLGGFAAGHLRALDAAELDAFETLLEESDNDLKAWILGHVPVPKRHDTSLMTLLLKFNNDL